MGTAPRMVSAGAPAQVAPEFCAEVVVGLSQPGQKELPSKYLYDEVGSALFDVICLLPEYGLSRAGMRLLQRHSQEIVSLLPSAGDRRGIGQRQRTEDAALVGSAFAAAAGALLPDRYFRQRAFALPTRNRPD